MDLSTSENNRLIIDQDANDSHSSISITSKNKEIINEEPQPSTSGLYILKPDESGVDDSSEDDFYDLSPADYAKCLTEAQNEAAIDASSSILNGLEKLILQQRL